MVVRRQKPIAIVQAQGDEGVNQCSDGGKRRKVKYLRLRDRIKKKAPRMRIQL